MDYSSIVNSQCQYLVRTVTKENFSNVREDFKLLSTTFGLDADRILVRTLLTEAKKIKNIIAPDASERVLLNLVDMELQAFTQRANFCTIFADASSDDDFIARLTERTASVLTALSVGLVTSFNEPSKECGFKLLIGKVLPAMTGTVVSQLPEHILRQLASVLANHADRFATLDSVSTEHVRHITATYRKHLSSVPVTTVTECDEPAVSLKQIMEELGPACLATAEAFRSLLEVIPMSALTVPQIAAALCLIANPHSSDISSSGQGVFVETFSIAMGAAIKPASDSWNVQNFVNELNACVKGLDWKAVLRALDQPGLKLSSNRSFMTLIQVCTIAGVGALPVDCFYGCWKNKTLQLSAIQFALRSPPTAVTFGSGSKWDNLGLVESLLMIGQANENSSHFNVKKMLVDDPMRNSPEDFLLKLMACKNPDYSMFQLELVRSLIVQLAPQMSETTTATLRDINSELLVFALNNAHQMELLKTEVVVEMVRNGGLVAEMLSCATSPALVFQLGHQCSLTSTQHTSFGTWMTELFAGKLKAAVDPTALSTVAMEFVEEKYNELKEREAATVAAGDSKAAAPSFDSSVLDTVINVLVALQSPFLPVVVAVHSRDIFDDLKTRLGPVMESRISRSVDDTAIQLYKDVYAGNMTVDELMDVLIRLRDSGSNQDMEVHQGLVKKLFEEFKFFGNYPEKELLLSARIYGALVSRNVLVANQSPTGLPIILRCILSCLVRPQSESLKRFALVALDGFKERLPEWPQYVGHLLKIADELEAAIPGISQFLEGDAPRQAAVPPQATQDRISFLLNNLDQSNMETSSAECANLITKEYFQYFAEYLVSKRVALEPNFHRNYVMLIERLGLQQFEQTVVQSAYTMVRAFLKSEKIRVHSGDRSVLKNLGAWIGLMTLARDRPVLARDIDLKELLLQAMAEGKLIAVVPFVAKVLESTPNSRVFSVRNPWLIGILNALAEIYQFPDLKLTLRFELEVLCNKLSIPIHDVIERSKITPGSLQAKLESIYRQLDISNSTDFHQSTVTRMSDEHRQQQQPGQQVQGQQQPQQQTPGPSRPIISQPSKSVLDNFNLQVRVPGELPLLQQCPALHGTLRVAVEAAIKEIINPVVERSVVISCSTTRELVIKDFVSDPDDAKLRRSAQLMARNLASNLAMVTCKEPLRTGIRKHMQAQFMQHVPTELHALIADTVEAILRENVDIGVPVVERVAADAAMSSIEENLAAYIEERRKLKGAGQFPSFHMFDERAIRHVNSLPEHLRPREGLQYIHKRVYDDFGAPAAPQPQQTQQTSPQPPQQAAMAGQQPGLPQAMQPGMPVSADQVTQQVQAAVDELNQIIQLIEREASKHYQIAPEAVLSLTQPSFAQSTLSTHHDAIKQNLCRIPAIITADNAIHFCRHVFEKLTALFERMQDRQQRQNPVLSLVSETYLLVLQSARERDTARRGVVPELTRLLLNHERRWQFKDITVNFIRLRLIDISQLDTHLTQTLSQDGGRSVVEFAGTIVQRCLVDEKLASQKDLKNTLDALEKIAAQARGRQAQTAQPNAQAQPQATPPQGPATPSRAPEQAGDESQSMRVRIPTFITDNDLRGQVRGYFKEWLQICLRKLQQQDTQTQGSDAPQQPTAQQQAMSFVGKLQQAGMLKADSMLEKFLMLLMEMSVEEYCTQAAALARSNDSERRQNPTGTIPAPPAEPFPSDPSLFVWVDAFSDLIVLLIKCCAWGSNPNRQQGTEQRSTVQAEVALVSRVLQVVCKMLINNHDFFAGGPNASVVHGIPPFSAPHVAQKEFMQQPYFRFLSNLLIALYPPPTDDGSHTVNEILTLFANTLNAINPSRLPGFAFGWLELISHRIFMPKLLNQRGGDGWVMFHRLIMQCLRFMEPYLRSVELNDAMRLFYKASMKILLVLLHDFPDFLCTYHFSLCDAIPPSCIQLRNVILSSFPRNMKLPDPFTPNLKVDLLPEIAQAPQIQDNYKDVLTPKPAQGSAAAVVPAITIAELDNYLANRQAGFPRTILSRLKLAQPQNGSTYNATLLNAMVLYLGARTVEELHREGTTAQITDSPAMDIFKELACKMDPEGRYLLLNAMVNQLRYPNNHTHYFSCAVLQLWTHACPESEVIQEQITRTLLERLIVNRPHPWGLLITFIELVKNARYDFWSKPFRRCTPELERLFESVGQTCVGGGQQQPQAAAAAVPPK
eukprot:PhM_4_TR14152/c0_g1_i1/m.51542/K12604/CNOT1, NOT1; CCR4-NOT transcription complex subunit 1